MSDADTILKLESETNASRTWMTVLAIFGVVLFVVAIVVIVLVLTRKPHPYNIINMNGSSSSSSSASRARSLQQLSKSDLERKLVQKDKMVVAFVMAGCGHCKQMMPSLTEAATKSNVAICSIDLKDAGNLANLYGIRGAPTLIKFDAGAPIAEMQSRDRSTQAILKFANTNAPQQ